MPWGLWHALVVGRFTVINPSTLYINYICWIKLSCANLQIRRSKVDSFELGRKIRYRRLKAATLTRDLGVEIPACSYLVTLDGANEPNQMQIEIDSYCPSKGKDSVVSLPMNQVPPSQALVPSFHVYPPPTPYRKLKLTDLA